VVLRYTRDLPDDVWRLACRQMRANASMMVYSDEEIVPAMEAAGIPPGRAVTYTMHGCNWPDVPGVQRTGHTHFVHLPRLLRQCLVDAADGATDLDAIWATMEAALAADAEVAFAAERGRRAEWAARAPGTLHIDDCFLEGPVERARSWTVGGVEYPTVVVSICGLATAADMLAAVETCCCPGGLPLPVVVDALEADFAAREDLRQRLLAAPKFGQDDERADRHAVRLLETALGAVEAASRRGQPDQVLAFRCLETDMRHRPFGADLGATPDGRRAGAPLSENTSPTPGVCHRGLTAMLRSLAKLPFHRIHSGALNLRLQPSHFAGEAGLDRLCQVLRTYFDLGGLQAQVSLASVEELRDAQAHPERHRDLMVRITGYSAAFVDMTPAAQEEIIRREEMGG
ncbi:MAG: pyruvate formate lyase family protein, partial [Gemmatimonadota bacterium]